MDHMTSPGPRYLWKICVFYVRSFSFTFWTLSWNWGFAYGNFLLWNYRSSYFAIDISKPCLYSLSLVLAIHNWDNSSIIPWFLRISFSLTLDHQFLVAKVHRHHFFGGGGCNNNFSSGFLPTNLSHWNVPNHTIMALAYIGDSIVLSLFYYPWSTLQDFILY